MAKEFVGYSVRSALKSGIKLVTVSADPEYGENCFVSKHGEYFNEGAEIFRSWDAALAAAEQMRADEIALLRKQLARLESLTFEEPK